MAYKFQMGTGILSGALEPAIDGKYDLGSSGMEWKDLYVDGTANIDSLVADTADINGGTVDATVIGGATPAAGTFTTVAGSTGTFSGILKTDDATDATSTTDGSLQTDGGLSVVKDCVFGDDVSLLSDASVLNFGADKDVTLTHVADTGLLVNSSRQLQFGDSGTHIAQSADATLKLTSDGIIEMSVGAQGAKLTGVDPRFIIGDGGAEDTIIVFDGNATDYHIGLDDGTDKLEFGVGPDHGTTIAMTIDTAQQVAVTATTDASSTSTGALTVAGGASVAKDLWVGDDLTLDSDSAVISFGDDQDVTLTHVADTGLLLNSTMKLQFNDASQFIQGASATVMEIGATDEIGLTATLVDMDANLDLDGTMDCSGVATFQTGIVPDATNGAYLGTSAAQWSDLFLGTGAVINFDNGDVTMTHANDVLTIGGSSSPTLTATLTNALSKATNSGLAMSTYNASAAVSDLAVDLNDLSAADVSVANDSIAIIDANDSNATRKESIADLVAGIAGTGLSASNGQLSVSSASSPNAVGDAAATLTEAFNYASATITANRVWTLPASAGLSVGDVVSVKAATINTGLHIAITPAGSQTIDGATDAILLESSYGAVQLKYVAADTWMIF